MLLMSEFGAMSSGKVSAIKNIRDIFESRSFENAKTELLYDGFKWPNNIRVVPSNVFNDGINHIEVPDGFLPPGKSNGNIFIMSFEHEKWVSHQISELKSGYFYHEGEWIDLNGDGRIDYLTA